MSDWLSHDSAIGATWVLTAVIFIQTLSPGRRIHASSASIQMSMEAVGSVRTAVREPLDDVWGGLVSTIVLDESKYGPEALLGLDAFSHVEIVFLFHLVPEDGVERGARHPRGRSGWPRAGIFAQRAKNRPNRIGVTVCRLRAVRGIEIEVEGLDAIDGTPVLDIKPYMREFAPQGEVRQPEWASELMSGYWNQYRIA